jgi:DNA-directed RNA polymerase subunit RPC12/RpoP
MEYPDGKIPLMMHAKAIPGEPTRFHVSSNRYGCTECEARFLIIDNPFMAEGMACPKCGKGRVELRYCLVDIAALTMNGQCSCEWFSYSIQPKVKLMSKERRLSNPVRCAHISYARSFCLNILLKLHIMEHGEGNADEGI